jgi:hypothetical protein
MYAGRRQSDHLAVVSLEQQGEPAEAVSSHLAPLPEPCLRTAVATGLIKAITLDTSTFEQHSLRLETGLLKQLNQFASSSIVFVVSDVIKSEVIDHLASKTEEAQRNLDKSLRAATEFWPIDPSLVSDFRSQVIGGFNPRQVASQRFSDYEKSTAIEIVGPGEHASIDLIMQAYFQCKPPFATSGKKKNEFPDAVALFSIEAWAELNSTKVIVVSRDNDWKDYCLQSERLILVEDLGRALGIFQLDDATEICQHLSDRALSGEIAGLNELVEAAINDELEAIELSPLASSNFRYEHDYTTCDLQSFTIEGAAEGEPVFQAINYEDDSIVVEAVATADVSVKFEFSFYTYDSVDREEISLGSGSATVDEQLTFRLILTLHGNLAHLGGDVDVDEAEATLTSTAVLNCGEIEPDWVLEDR